MSFVVVMFYDQIIATIKDLLLRTTSTRVTQKSIKILTKFASTTKIIILSFYVSKTMMLISWIILTKIIRKIKAIRIIITLTLKRFKVIKIVTTKIIVSTTIKTKLLIMQIMIRFVNLSKRLKCLLNIRTIIMSVLVYEFKAYKRRLIT